jgi:hypothetical protein
MNWIFADHSGRIQNLDASPECTYNGAAPIYVLLIRGLVMKANITLKVDAKLLREARVLAAEEGRSVSALLTDRIEEMVRQRKAFDKARRRALARLREGLDLRWTPTKTRDELHER